MLTTRVWISLGPRLASRCLAPTTTSSSVPLWNVNDQQQDASQRARTMSTRSGTLHKVAARKMSSKLHRRAAEALGKNLPREPLNGLNGGSLLNNNSLVPPSEEKASTPKTETAPPKSNSAAVEAILSKPKPAPRDLIIQPPMSSLQLHNFAPRIVVAGIGGAGGNAVNNMIAQNLSGVDFLAMNTDAQHLANTLTDNRLQIGRSKTGGLGCGANPDAGRLAAEESLSDIEAHLEDATMVFLTAGMGGGTGTGAAPVVADLCTQMGILTVAVVTVPFSFEGSHRMRLAMEGVARLKDVVDTLIVIPNQNLFRLAPPETGLMDCFVMADNVLLAGVKSITDLMTKPGIINVDFADVQSVMCQMGNAMLGTGVGTNDDDDRALVAATMALENPLLLGGGDIATSKGMLVNIAGGRDMTLVEVDRAAQAITSRISDKSANIIFGTTYDERLEGTIQVSVVATGIDDLGDLEHERY
eukprot:scaffold3902_cov53-Attheya_sp.AAC.2